MKGYSRYFWFLHFIGDMFVINISFLSYYFIKFNSFVFSDKYRLLLLIFNALWILVAFMINLYQLKRIRRLDKVLINLFKAFLFNVILISGILFSMKAFVFSREHLYGTYLLLFVLILLWRYFAIKLIYLYRKSGYNYRRVVIIGGGKVAKQLYEYFRSNDIIAVNVYAIFSNEKPEFNVDKDISCRSLDDIKEYVLSNPIDEIYYTLSLDDTNLVKEIVEFTDKNLVRLRIVPDFRGFMFKRVNIDFFDDVPIITFRDEPLTDFINRVVKRIFDIIFSSLVILLILSWLYTIIAILIKLSSRGPILFKQKRSGIDNQEFICYKFRSMRQTDAADIKQAVKGDNRITKIGKILRKTSLDEFPQFVNVFLGDMSIVGPRPHMLKHTEEYSKLINKYMVRQLVKPGITGAAQIKGYRGETKELHEMEARVRLDVWYIENWSLALDINIIFLTVWQVLKGHEKAF